MKVSAPQHTRPHDRLQCARVCARADRATETQLPDEEGFYYACKVADVPTNKGVRIKINGKPVGVFKVKAEKTRVYALADKCSHQGTSLAGTCTRRCAAFSAFPSCRGASSLVVVPDSISERGRYLCVREAIAASKS